MKNSELTINKVKYEVINLPEFTGGAIRLYSLDGRLIATQQVIETRGRVRFDLSRLASGTYVVVFANESHRLGQHVLIKR